MVKKTHQLTVLGLLRLHEDSRRIRPLGTLKVLSLLCLLMLRVVLASLCVLPEVVVWLRRLILLLLLVIVIIMLSGTVAIALISLELLIVRLLSIATVSLITLALIVILPLIIAGSMLAWFL